MDDLNYQYDPVQANNRLVNFTDASNHNVANTAFSNDLKYYNIANPASVNRFQYDANGNLTQDLSNGISSISWNGIGKVSKVAMDAGRNLSLMYDPMGNRFSKSLQSAGNRTYQKEFYIRDASGNVLAVYRQLQKYRLEKQFAQVLMAVIDKPTFGTDVGAVTQADGAFAEALIRRVSQEQPEFLNGQLAQRPVSFYAQAGARQSLLIGNKGLLNYLDQQSPAMLVSLVADSFREDFFRPLLADIAPSDRAQYLSRLADPNDSATMNAILGDLGTTVRVADAGSFGEFVSGYLAEGNDGRPLLESIRNRMSGEALQQAAGRLLAFDQFRTTPVADWSFGTIDNYLLSRLGESGSNNELVDQYFNNSQEAGATLGQLVSAEGRASMVYSESPAAFLDAMRAQVGFESSAALISDALAESGTYSPASFALKLGQLNEGNTTVAQIPLVEVMEYNQFYLAEHHIYGSSRLGIKSYWANQYLYEWDGGKTIAQNAAAFDASEFNYRRPWYSATYNSLIQAGSLLPWGQASTMGIYSERVLGQKRYELNNHLGNVMSVVTDKVTEVPQVAGSVLPAPALRRASLSAAYDYYPFGMLMPERYVEDASQQCIPVTHTRYVKVNVPIDVAVFDSPVKLEALSPKPGTGLDFIEDRGGMAVLFSDGSAPEERFIGASVALASSAVAGEELSAVVQLRGLGEGETVLALEQQLGDDWQALAELPVRFEEEVKLSTVSKGTGAVRLSVTALAQGKVGVVAIKYLSYDQVQQSYVTLSCNSDAAGGNDYRFGFNGMQKDNEVKGTGNSLDFGARLYDSRLGRWLSLDPAASKYPLWSPFSAMANNPITFTDPDGREPVYVSRSRGNFLGYDPREDWPALRPNQWYCIDGKNDPESFASAAQFNTINNRPWEYPSIFHRHDYYVWANKQLAPKGVKWYDAAAIVTQDNAVGAAEGINLWWLNDEAEAFLKGGNQYLFSYNMTNARNLLNGTFGGSFKDASGSEIFLDGMTGKARDYAMVRFEQTQVENFIQSFKKNHTEEEFNSVMSSINYSMTSSFGPDEVQQVMEKDFSDKGKKFNFANYEDRVTLGQRMIDNLYEKDKKK